MDLFGSAYQTVVITYIVVSLLLFVLAIYLIRKKISTEKIFLILMLGMGGLLLIAEPIFITPDERTHYANAYDISNYIFGEECSIGASTRRKVDWDLNYDGEVSTKEGYDEFLSSFVGEQEKEAVYFFDGNKTVVSRILYLFCGLGITLARLLGLNFGWLAVIGEACNLIFYSLMMYCSAKLMPVGKRIIYVIGLLPICLQEAASYSYDAVIIPCGICLIALALSIRKKTVTLNWKTYALFGFCALVLFVAKGKAYVPLILGALIIVYQKEWFKRQNKKIWIGAIGLAVMAVALCFTIGHGAQNIYTTLITVPVIQRTGEFTNPPIYYLTHPIETIAIYFNTLMVNGSHYVYQILGGALGQFQIFVWKPIVFGWLVLLVFAAVRHKGEEWLSGKLRSWLGALSIITVLLTMFAMLVYETHSDAVVIEAYQGRYVLPVLLAALLAFGFWKVPIIDGEKYKEEYFLVAADGLLFAAVLSFLLQVP